ncbi:homeobox-leucine zipper protein ATHB-52-like [Eucalyptus grandis]|uniref:homeobox-leucine zipper protein ATHB-52-like n=1 Tax=Eucalyptus grandis TaxID=71139 RepID=UPI00192EDA5E|nr:homeobox-leucine zipper protein ATHB-52-like [Eucalyptus grandis]
MERAEQMQLTRHERVNEDTIVLEENETLVKGEDDLKEVLQERDLGVKSEGFFLFPDPTQKDLSELGVPPKQVTLWYQNWQTRWQTQILELNHGALQLKLDDALAKKPKLGWDIVLLEKE